MAREFQYSGEACCELLYAVTTTLLVCCSEGLRAVDTEDERDGWPGLIERLGRDVLLGGEWRPAVCEANTHLAVIIPCRDRDVHLRILLRHFIPVLQRQLVHFRIFVVEQVLN